MAAETAASNVDYSVLPILHTAFAATETVGKAAIIITATKIIKMILFILISKLSEKFGEKLIALDVVNVANGVARRIEGIVIIVLHDG